MAAKVIITKITGEVEEILITPAIEVAFENKTGEGFFKTLVEQQKQSDAYWLAWEAMRRSGQTVKPFGDEFLDTLKKVEVVAADPLA
jgi:hypothetical protein